MAYNSKKRGGKWKRLSRAKKWKKERGKISGIRGFLFGKDTERVGMKNHIVTKKRVRFADQSNGNELVLSSLPLNLRASESKIKISASNQSFKLSSEGKLNNIKANSPSVQTPFLPELCDHPNPKKSCLFLKLNS